MIIIFIKLSAGAHSHSPQQNMSTMFNIYLELNAEYKKILKSVSTWNLKNFGCLLDWLCIGILIGYVL